VRKIHYPRASLAGSRPLSIVNEFIEYVLYSIKSSCTLHDYPPSVIESSTRPPVPSDSDIDLRSYRLYNYAKSG